MARHRAHVTVHTRFRWNGKLQLQLSLRIDDLAAGGQNRWVLRDKACVGTFGAHFHRQLDDFLYAPRLDQNEIVRLVGDVHVFQLQGEKLAGLRFEAGRRKPESLGHLEPDDARLFSGALGRFGRSGRGPRSGGLFLGVGGKNGSDQKSAHDGEGCSRERHFPTMTKSRPRYKG